VRILLTNWALVHRAGSELYLSEVAAGLLARGHSPVVFSPRLGPVAKALRAATVPVVDRLDRISEPPDLIHGQHHLEAMAALLHFPGVPAVFVCHGWLPWVEMPPRFPRIHRYVAVDFTTRERLVSEQGIAPERVEVVLNFVDLGRFRPRGPLPPKPRRALVFSNKASEETYLPVVRKACARFNVEVDVAGVASGRAASRPEELLPAYDLVFAKGRAALEALAVGAAVIVCDQAGAGPLVASANLDDLRRLNFGVRTLRNPLEPEALARQIERYDADDADEVSRRIRATAGLEEAVDHLAGIYEAVLAEHRERGNPDPAEESRAAAEYLQELNRLFEAETQYLQTRLETETAQLQSLQGTATWRLRERLVKSPLLGVYRWLRGV
jgi:glycosyltransferase involved in cell wall biosynthesis